jgi:hypothetical protein
MGEETYEMLAEEARVLECAWREPESRLSGGTVAASQLPFLIQSPNFGSDLVFDSLPEDRDSIRNNRLVPGAAQTRSIQKGKAES